MKFDGVTLFERATDGHGAKVIGYCDKHMTINMLKIDTEPLTRRENGVASPRESKVSEKIGPPYFVHHPSPHSKSDIEDSIESDKNEDKPEGTLCSLPTGKTGAVEKERYSYTEKTMSEIELPGTLTCFSDPALHRVKDICIDEGSHSVVPASTEDWNFSSRSNHSVPNGSHSAPEDTTESTPDAAEDEGKMVVVSPSVDAINEKQLPTLPKLDTDQQKMDPSGSNGIDDNRPSTNYQKIDQGTSEPGVTPAEASPADGSIQKNERKEKSADSEEESGVITYDFNSVAAAVNGYSGNKECKNNQQTGQVRYPPDSKDATIDDATASVQIISAYHDHGDSDFNGPNSMSDPLAASGHIPYSGSISLRSDSSTTSARSFAFPVLQSEWNCSPVRMAKADRRHLKKHRSWNVRLLCCKF